MIKELIITLFVFFLTCPLWAAGDCTLCGQNVSDQDLAKGRAIACSNHHCVDQDCLAHMVQSWDNLEELEVKGFLCCDKSCSENLSLEDVRNLINPVERSKLEQRILKSKLPEDPHHAEFEIKRLQYGIEQAFNGCCPIDGCGSTLGPLEGCNAVKCSNKDCQASFCHLCQKPVDEDLAHGHVREHSGDFWENRPGFKERFQWLVARQKLAHLFSIKVSNSIRSSALKSQADLLKKQEMWPMPAGLLSKIWIKKVKESFQIHEISKEKMIELLQNEFIFRKESGDKNNASFVQAELKHLGSTALASLDIRDAGGIENPRDAHDQGVSPAFLALGPTVQVGNLVWSNAPIHKYRAFYKPDQLSFLEAKTFCETLSPPTSRLPTRDEYQDLANFLGAPDHFDYHRLPLPHPANLANAFIEIQRLEGSFWTSTENADKPTSAYNFLFADGKFYSEPKVNPNYTRCVFPLVR